MNQPYQILYEGFGQYDSNSDIVRPPILGGSRVDATLPPIILGALSSRVPEIQWLLPARTPDETDGPAVSSSDSPEESGSPKPAFAATGDGDPPSPFQLGEDFGGADYEAEEDNSEDEETEETEEETGKADEGSN